MAVRLLIPAPLRPFVDNQSEVVLEKEGTVKSILDELIVQHTGVKDHLLKEEGALRSFVNIYVNDEDIRYKDGEQTLVKDGDSISIIPSIAGGVL